MFLKISQSSQRNLSQDDGELIALNHLLFYQNFFPLLHYVLSGSLSLSALNQLSLNPAPNVENDCRDCDPIVAAG